jgi:hypothetical protein
MKSKIQNAFKNVSHTVMVSFVLLITLVPLAALAQDVPSDLKALIGMKLEDAQTSLEQKGYEIAGSSIFKKEQLWYNEKENVCINIAFEKKGDHTVTAVKQGDVAKCKEGVAAARKVTESYHDGSAPANAAAIEKEREKLRAKGFVVSYWIKDISPGRSSEYWKNETSGTCMLIVWNTADQGNVSTSDCAAEYKNNPYPKK